MGRGQGRFSVAEASRENLFAKNNVPAVYRTHSLLPQLAHFRIIRHCVGIIGLNRGTPAFAGRSVAII